MPQGMLMSRKRRQASANNEQQQQQLSRQQAAPMVTPKLELAEAAVPPLVGRSVQSARRQPQPQQHHQHNHHQQHHQHQNHHHQRHQRHQPQQPPQPPPPPMAADEQPPLSVNQPASLLPSNPLVALLYYIELQKQQQQQQQEQQQHLQQLQMGDIKQQDISSAPLPPVFLPVHQAIADDEDFVDDFSDDDEEDDELDEHNGDLLNGQERRRGNSAQHNQLDPADIAKLLNQSASQGSKRSTSGASGSGSEDTGVHHCLDCGKRYSTSSNLARHRQTHRDVTDKKAKKCPECDKIYVSMPAFSMHLRTHNQGCICSICGKSFSRPWLLQGHMRTHTGEKPFRCKICDKAFADKSNLRAHIQTHSTTKPFVCDRCNKAFALKSYLCKHVDSTCMRANQNSANGQKEPLNLKVLNQTTSSRSSRANKHHSTNDNNQL